MNWSLEQSSDNSTDGFTLVLSVEGDVFERTVTRKELVEEGSDGLMGQAAKHWARAEMLLLEAELELGKPDPIMRPIREERARQLRNQARQIQNYALRAVFPEAAELIA